jgi:hypothetical protein
VPKFYSGERRVSLQSPDESAEEEENYSSDSGDADGAEIKLASCNVTPSEEARSQPTADECADDAKEDGDDAAGRVPPWHQKLRQRPGYETEKNPVKPERQTLFLPGAKAVLRNARSGAAVLRRHAVNPE